GQSARVQRWVRSLHFAAADGELCLVPGDDGGLARVLAGVSAPEDPWAYAALPTRLPRGRYQLSPAPEAGQSDAAALGWALGTYRFTRYKKNETVFASLVWPEAADRKRVSALVEGIGLCRDLINTPAQDLGPSELVQEGQRLAQQHGAKARVLKGEKQLEQFPSVYAVGRAAVQPPHLLDLTWGKESHPKVSLVGKGVVFDSGGLDLKPASNMKLMKKDMGGAALVLGVAHVLMSLQLPIRLRVIIPAVENAIGPNAMRPLDVLASRKGLTVEVGNTDAEGRLILSDALALADEEQPELLIDAATLTGAARTALGTSLPALFSNRDETAAALLAAGLAARDPLWRMPLHQAYAKQLESSVADLCNVSNDSYGGAITAALFLERFVSAKTPWVHIDTMAWNLESRPGRPVGGEAFGLRALVEFQRQRYAPLS
ncbi:MAG TPA: leucyl aminopeptidase family protein, partial [Polyangiaceae bacterium]|nr:leucyl aminopeptidase family protein [Polyangiaceae bacterium]